MWHQEIVLLVDLRWLFTRSPFRDTIHFFLYELHRADNSLHGKRNLITMKTETTIIRIDEDDAMRDKDDDDPPISIPFCNWYLIYDERFKERSVILNKIEGHGLLVRTDRYDVRDNWPILILFSRDHIGLSFFRIKVNLWWITSTKTDCTWCIFRVITSRDSSKLPTSATQRPFVKSRHNTLGVWSTRQLHFPLFSHGKLISIS